MSFLEWDESLRLGVDLCDKQHQVLISHMNKLYDLSEKNAGFTELKSVLQDLEKSVVTHFADEEAYMQRIGFSGFKNHKAIHEQLLSKFQDHVTRFKKEGKFDDHFFAFLKVWLSAHIKGIDMKYADEQRSKIA